MKTVAPAVMRPLSKSRPSPWMNVKCSRSAAIAVMRATSFLGVQRVANPRRLSPLEAGQRSGRGFRPMSRGSSRASRRPSRPRRPAARSAPERRCYRWARSRPRAQSSHRRVRRASRSQTAATSSSSSLRVAWFARPCPTAVRLTDAPPAKGSTTRPFPRATSDVRVVGTRRLLPPGNLNGLSIAPRARGRIPRTYEPGLTVRRTRATKSMVVGPRRAVANSGKRT